MTTNCGKYLKRWEYQTILPAFSEICMQVKRQQLEPDMEKWISWKLGKEYDKAVYLNYMQSTPWKLPGCVTHKLESRLSEEISTTLEMPMMPL